MNVTYKNYTLEFVSGNNFNLIETIRVEKFKRVDKKLVPTGEIGDKEINHGYSMPFERCIECIIGLEVAKKAKTVDLKDYLKIYKAEKNEIMSMLK